MKVPVVFCFLVSSLAAALTPGKRYDFIAKDGQHIKNAELVKEERKGYLIKSEFVDEPYLIERSALVSEPKLSGEAIQKQKTVRRWYLYANGNLQTSSGDFAAYSKLFGGGSLNAAYRFGRMPYLGFNALAASLQYSLIANSPRRIDMMTFGVGPKWFFHFKSIKALDFFVLARPEISLLNFRSFTYSSTAAIAGAAVELGAHWVLKSNLLLTTNIGAKYLYDTTALVLMYNFSLGVGYAW